MRSSSQKIGSRAVMIEDRKVTEARTAHRSDITYYREGKYIRLRND